MEGFHGAEWPKGKTTKVGQNYWWGKASFQRTYPKTVTSHYLGGTSDKETHYTCSQCGKAFKDQRKRLKAHSVRPLGVLRRPFLVLVDPKWWARLAFPQEQRGLGTWSERH